MTDGELWAREQLALLRRRGFSPSALAGFLLASWRRAGEVRGARPELAAQARVWVAIGSEPWLAAWLLTPGRRQAARVGLAWWLGCGLMLDWHLGMLETEDGQARALGPADALTLLRAWLVPVVWTDPTAAVCALAALTDALDGPLARRTGATRAGRDFDGLVDTAFMLAALAGARRARLLPGWVVGVEAARRTLGVMYGVGSYFLAAQPPDRRTIAAARSLVPVRTVGLVLATSGRCRQAGEVLLGGGAIASLILALLSRYRRASQRSIARRAASATRATARTRRVV
ncbi:MAG: CDP-alcohol phosphatidyltransferase family protein [Solirubrobacteraceae bacterium]